MEKTFKSNNDINIYFYPNEHLHSFCICLYVLAGTLYENDTNCGITHFFEHIVFRNINTIIGGNLYAELDKYGLSMSACTYKEFVQFSIVGATKNFSYAADIIKKIYDPVKVSKDDFSLERWRIKSEIREDCDKTSLYTIANQEVWKDSPLKNSITGSVGTLNKISIKTINSWQKEILTPKNMFWYISGNVSEENIMYFKNSIEEYSFLKNTSKKDNSVFQSTDFFNRNNAILLKNSDFCKVMFCFDVDCKKSNKAERDLLYSILFDGENSKMYRELSENKGFIYSYDAKFEEYINIASLQFSFEVKQANLYESLRITVSLLNNLKLHSSNSLEFAKIPYTDNADLVLDNAEELNWNRSYEYYILKAFDKNLEDVKSFYSSVTDDNIKYLSNEIFKPNNLVLAIKCNTKKIEKAEIIAIISDLN